VSEIRDAYDTVAEEYQRRIGSELDGKPLDRALLAAFAEMVRGKGPVLDVGCGPGHVTAHLLGLGLPAGGLDLSPRMIDVARAACPARFEVGDMLELGDRRLAGLVALYAICNIPGADVARAAASFAAALAPGGLALVSFHIGDERVHLDEWWGHRVSIDFWFHPPQAVAAALEGAGLVIEARLERAPHPDVEHPSQRAYLLARKPA
jgi:SAM-dependent methyltransferase